jgi:hypothetical protein
VFQSDYSKMTLLLEMNSSIINLQWSQFVASTFFGSVTRAHYSSVLLFLSSSRSFRLLGAKCQRLSDFRQITPIWDGVLPRFERGILCSVHRRTGCCSPVISILFYSLPGFVFAECLI